MSSRIDVSGSSIGFAYDEELLVVRPRIYIISRSISLVPWLVLGDGQGAEIADGEEGYGGELHIGGRFLGER